MNFYLLWVIWFTDWWIREKSNFLKPLQTTAEYLKCAVFAISGFIEYVCWNFTFLCFRFFKRPYMIMMTVQLPDCSLWPWTAKKWQEFLNYSCTGLKHSRHVVKIGNPTTALTVISHSRFFENCIYVQFKNKWCWWSWNPKLHYKWTPHESPKTPQPSANEGGKNFSLIHQPYERMDGGMEVVWSLAKPFSIRPPTPYAEIAAAATGNTCPRSQGQSQG